MSYFPTQWSQLAEQYGRRWRMAEDIAPSVAAMIGFNPVNRAHLDDVLSVAESVVGFVSRVGFLLEQRRASEALQTMADALRAAHEIEPEIFDTRDHDERAILKALNSISARNAAEDAQRYRTSPEGRRLIASIERDKRRAKNTVEPLAV